MGEDCCDNAVSVQVLRRRPYNKRKDAISPNKVVIFSGWDWLIN
jgi:hypothetical protein